MSSYTRNHRHTGSRLHYTDLGNEQAFAILYGNEQAFEILFGCPVIQEIIAIQDLECLLIAQIGVVQTRKAFVWIEQTGLCDELHGRLGPVLRDVIVNAVDAVLCRQVDQEHLCSAAGKLLSKLIPRRCHHWIRKDVAVEQDVNATTLPRDQTQLRSQERRVG